MPTELIFVSLSKLGCMPSSALATSVTSELGMNHKSAATKCIYGGFGFPDRKLNICIHSVNSVSFGRLLYFRSHEIRRQILHPKW